MLTVFKVSTNNAPAIFRVIRGGGEFTKLTQRSVGGDE
jgi:hypothetical protein